MTNDKWLISAEIFCRSHKSKCSPLIVDLERYIQIQMHSAFVYTKYQFVPQTINASKDAVSCC